MNRVVSILPVSLRQALDEGLRLLAKRTRPLQETPLVPADTLHRRLRPLLACTIVFILGLLVFACTFEDDSENTGLLRADTESATPSETEADEEPRVRIFFLQTPWKTVLEKVAEETGATLVADRMPSGMFNRRDWKKHTRAEAIEVLNATLVTQKLRLVEKGDYIVLLDTKATRQRYDRPDVPDDGSVAEGNTAGRASSGTRPPRKYVRNFESVRPRDEVAEGRDFSGEEGSDIRRISGSSADVAKSIPSQAIEMQSRRAVDVARLIYQAYKPTAKLIEKGPDGLPAFQAYRQVTNDRTASRRTTPRLLFTMGIDADVDRLVVAETQERNRLLIELVEHVDRVPAYTDETVRLLVPHGDAEHLASQLEPTLSRLLAQRNAAEPAANAQPPEQPPAQPQEPQEPQEPQPKGSTQQEAVKALIGGLKGNVSIEALQDLGIMILRGNEKDVAAVMQVIEAIEELTAGTIPDIHLLRLRHVDSTALAELLSGVYESLGSITGRTGNPTVTVIPVVKPNAVIILAPVGEMESILKLADELDQPVDPNTELEVFRLRNAIASQVQTTLESFYDDREGLGTRVVVIADVRTNSVLVHARPADLAEVSRLIRRLDRGDSNAVNRMKIYPLKNAVADELAEFLETALRAAYDPSVSTGQLTGGGAGGGQGAQQLRDSKSIVLEFLTSEGSGKRLVRSGILSDIRVTANIRTNSLVVTAPEESQPLMEELIRQLDEPSSAVAEIKVFALENADASTTVRLLETLFPQEDQTGQVGVQVVGADDANSGLIPMRLSVDVRTNSIIAIGAADSLRVVEAILLKLDESDIRQRQTTVIKLKNSPVTDVANAINQFLTSQRDLAQVDPDLVSSVELLEREVIAVPEPVSNSLLLSATPRYFEEIIELVNRLDEAPAQVIIQALLVEVELENSDEFGIELGVQDSILFNRSSVSNIIEAPPVTTTAQNGVQTTSTSVLSQESTPGFNFNNVTLPLGANTSAGPGSLVGQAISSFALGRANGELGFGGLVLSAGSESLSVLIRALASKREVNILSRPQIRTLDNQLAQIQVGQQVPIVTGVNQTDNVATSNITQDDAGIILAVTPRISPDGMIVMEIAAEKSSFNGQGVPIFVDALTGNTIESPIKDITAISTTVSVPNGQTAVLGGMITKSEDKLERKVPWLGDLPYVGWPFRYDGMSTRRTELLIFLTPRVIRNSSDSEIIKQIEAERLHFLRSEAEEMHGPLFGVPEAEKLPSTSGVRSGEPSKFRSDKASSRPMLFNDRDVPTTTVDDDSFFQPPSSNLPQEDKSSPDVLNLDAGEASSSSRFSRSRARTRSADIQAIEFPRRQ
jgi:general secretion pathway protein D